MTQSGYLDALQLANILAKADIGVSPYCGRKEYSGLKILDYKGAGLAIIASGENGQPSIIEHKRTGWIVTPCDANALRDAIVHLAREQDLRKSLGKAARLEAEQYHTWQHTARELERVFSLVRGSRG